MLANLGYAALAVDQALQNLDARPAPAGTMTVVLGPGWPGILLHEAIGHGLVSIHFVNVISRPVVAPWGGGDGRFGTNPCCIGVPLAGEDPFVLDFATSRVAQGKMRVAHNEGRRVEPGHLIDEHGRPTTDPGVVVVPQSHGLFGALMTFGEHKGSGLALVCELLAGAVIGSASVATMLLWS